MVGLIAVRIGRAWTVTVIAAHPVDTFAVTAEVGHRAVAVATAVHQLGVLALAGSWDASEPWAAGQPRFARALSRHAQADTVDALLVLRTSIATVTTIQLISLEVPAPTGCFRMGDLGAPRRSSAHRTRITASAARPPADDNAYISSWPVAELIGAIIPALATVLRVVGHVGTPSDSTAGGAFARRAGRAIWLVRTGALSLAAGSRRKAPFVR